MKGEIKWFEVGFFFLLFFKVAFVRNLQPRNGVAVLWLTSNDGKDENVSDDTIAMLAQQWEEKRVVLHYALSDLSTLRAD